MSDFPNMFHEALAHNLAKKLAKQQEDMFTYGQSVTILDKNFIEEMAKLTPDEHRAIINGALKKLGERHE